MKPAANRSKSLISSMAPWLLAAAVGGCGSDGVTPSSPQANAQETLAAPGPAKRQPLASAASTPAPVKSTKHAPADASAGPTMPDGAKYTIICLQFGGSSHIAESKAAKEKLIRSTGRNEFYILHDEGQSTLYFGYYRAIEREIDPAEARRAESDFQFLRGLVDTSQHRLFPHPLKEPLAVADPEGPAEYDLTKLDRDKSPDDPTRRYWSIVIAAYTVDANPTGVDAGKSRKQLAVESVISARKQGVEAYYFNGDNVSQVCVGAWPRDAIAEQQSNQAQSNSDSGQTIVVSPAPLPPEVTSNLQNSGDVKVFQPVINIKDPSMLETWKQFKFYSVNGVDQINRITDPQTGRSVARPQLTFLVEIPKLQPNLLTNTAPVEDTAPAPLINPMAPTPSGGQLRSLTK